MKQKQKILSYRTIIEKDGTYYHGYVPALPGCHTQGDTIEQARKNLREVIPIFLLSYTKHNEPIPRNDVIEEIETFDLHQIFPKGTSFTYA